MSFPIEYVPGEQNDTTVPGLDGGKDTFDKITNVTTTATIITAIMNAGAVESAIPNLLYPVIFFFNDLSFS